MGEFLQVGLSSGSYKVTASKDGVGSQTLNSNVRQGPNNPLELLADHLEQSVQDADKPEAPSSGGFRQAAAVGDGSHEARGVHDEAIRSSTTSSSRCRPAPTATTTSASRTWQAAASEGRGGVSRRSIESEADRPEPYNGLAGVYNAQKKFDHAQARYEGNSSSRERRAARRRRRGGGRATTRASSFSTRASLPTRRDSSRPRPRRTRTTEMRTISSGMTALNLGQIPEAVTALQAYLKVEPHGPSEGGGGQGPPARRSAMLKK